MISAYHIEFYSTPILLDVGPLTDNQVRIFIRGFLAAFEECKAEAIPNSQIRFTDIMNKSVNFSQTGPQVLSTLLKHKCNLPNLRFGSAAAVVDINGVVTNSAIMNQLLS